MNPDFDLILDGFPRAVPVFPLAEVVLFPGAVLPLHVFEPRYRKMLDDVLAGDRLMAMALLKQAGADEFHETVCVGHVIHHKSLPEGRSNIALLGLSAGHAVEVPGDDKPYRSVEVELISELLDAGEDDDARLNEVLPRTVPGASGIEALRDQLKAFIAPERLSAALINTCALSAPIFPLHKLELLMERSVSGRLDRLIYFLERPWQWN